MFKNILINLITAYQKTHQYRDSFFYGIGIAPQACRHSPSCSQYAKLAINKYGTIRGSLLSLKRIISCNPLVAPKVEYP